MNKCLAILAVVSLAATGCAGSRMLGTTPQAESVVARGQSPEEYNAMPCSCDVCCDPCCGDGCDPYGSGCSDGGDPGRGGLLGGRGGRGGGNGACSACGGAGCSACRGGFCRALGTGFCPHAHGYPEMPAFNPGPPVGQVAYPYYTTRGPRDFLQNNPPTIGPY